MFERLTYALEMPMDKFAIKLEKSGTVVQWLSLPHNFIQRILNSGLSEIRDGENLWELSWLEIRLNTFGQSTIPQKQFIIIIIMIIIKMSPSLNEYLSLDTFKVFRIIFMRILKYFEGIFVGII